MEIHKVLEFEKSNWAGGSVLDNDFYTAPSDSTEAPPGTLLKVEKTVDTTKYLLPPTTALSRIMYQSETFNGSRVPVSAFILWPFSPQSQHDGYPVVGWAHGTSGWSANAAPSNHKNLWQHYIGPYQLALQGYVVVGTDYAGLGVKYRPSGEPIIHEYLASPAQAKDVIYSVQAAQKAFPELSKRWVAIGHSQGGGAVWGIAQHAATNDIDGYLGGVSMAPYTNILEEQKTNLANALGAVMVPAIESIYPDFKASDTLTPEGEAIITLIQEYDAGISTGVSMITGVNLFKSNWRQSHHFQKFQHLTCNGGKPTKRPLFIAHGTVDAVLSESQVRSIVHTTAGVNPEASITYHALEGVSHVGAVLASQRSWMKWIAERFAGDAAEAGCRIEVIKGARGETHQMDQNWYLESATEPWQAPGP